MKVVFLDAATLPTTLSFETPAVEYVSYSSTAPASVIDRISDATVVITNKVRLGGEELRSAKQLRLIAVAAAGTDNIDKEAAAELGIEVANVPDYGSDSVAEHVIATLFALRRHVVTYAAAALDGRWAASEQFCWNGPRISDVGGTVFGVVGRGRIGEAAARLARGLGMQVLFAQNPGTPYAEDELPLEALLERADVLTLHVPLTPETRNMIGKKALARMKRSAVIVNTGRGALIDAEALVAALREGVIGGAAIDVLDVEPPPADHPLLAGDVPNLLVTPHVAWASENAQARLARKLEQLVEKQLA
jgi:glycerate dehydrogenase